MAVLASGLEKCHATTLLNVEMFPCVCVFLKTII